MTETHVWRSQSQSAVKHRLRSLQSMEWGLRFQDYYSIASLHWWEGRFREQYFWAKKIHVLLKCDITLKTRARQTANKLGAAA